jgi:hypothetical protein
MRDTERPRLTGAGKMASIGLKEAVEALRAELNASILAAGNESLRFEVGQITMEFQVGIERTSEGSGGIKFWVVELGGKVGDKSTEIHKVTIPLQPMRDGRPVLTGSDEIPK